jgi:hypothetical protein
VKSIAALEKLAASSCIHASGASTSTCPGPSYPGLSRGPRRAARGGTMCATIDEPCHVAKRWDRTGKLGSGETG